MNMHDDGSRSQNENTNANYARAQLCAPCPLDETMRKGLNLCFFLLPLQSRPDAKRSI